TYRVLAQVHPAHRAHPSFPTRRSSDLRASAAHSVLVVGDTNAVEIQAGGSLGRAPASVRCERAEESGHQWIAATHDGYRQRFGRSEEHTSELQSPYDLVCRLLLEKKKT